jgi:anti-sigma B factor antagonist
LVTDTSTRQVEPDISVFAISGRLGVGNTLFSVDSAIRKLIDGGSRKLVIDLAGLNSIDSSGIGMLIACHSYMEQAGGNFRIAGAQGFVDETLQTVGIGAMIALDPDVETACGKIVTGGLPPEET